jgi:hypothetical protein
VFADHARFMAYAARVMRGLIIDDVRRRRSQKRGGLFELTSLVGDHADRVAEPHALVQISDALDELAGVEPELAEIIDLKFFCGSRSPRSPRCAASRSARSSAPGKRAASICTTRSRARIRSPAPRCPA